MSDCSKHIRQREAFTEVPQAPGCNPPVIHQVPIPGTIVLILIGVAAYRMVRG